MDRHGEVRLGGRVLVRHGKIWCGPVWLVKVRRSRRGKSWYDMAGYGKAVGAGYGSARRGPAGQGGRG
jgi:hypothetical protein